MIPPLQQGALVREHHRDLQARADRARLANEAKAAHASRPHLLSRGWSSLLWVGHFFLYRHTEPETSHAPHHPLAGSAP